MIVFKAQGKQYKYPGSWKDIMLGKFIEFLETVEKDCPELLSEIMKETDEEKRKELFDQVDPVVYTHEFLPYFAKYVSFFTGMPFDMIMGINKFHDDPPMNVEQLEKLWWFIESRVLGNTTADEGFTGFTIDGVEYILPERMMKNATVGEFMEATQLQASTKDVLNGIWKSLPKVIAVLARPKGESYNSKNVEARSQLFREKLNMHNALNVAFFLHRQSGKLNSNFQIFTIAQQLSRLKQG